MNTFYSSAEFNRWLAHLKDKQAKAAVLQRLDRASKGNFGDCEPVGDGVSEMRIHHGAGYRVYFTRRGAVVYWLLLGGNKSTQQRDIAAAKAMLANLPEESS